MFAILAWPLCILSIISAIVFCIIMAASAFDRCESDVESVEYALAYRRFQFAMYGLFASGLVFLLSFIITGPNVNPPANLVAPKVSFQTEYDKCISPVADHPDNYAKCVTLAHDIVAQTNKPDIVPIQKLFEDCNDRYDIYQDKPGIVERRNARMAVCKDVAVAEYKAQME